MGGFSSLLGQNIDPTKINAIDSIIGFEEELDHFELTLLSKLSDIQIYEDINDDVLVSRKEFEKGTEKKL